MKVLLVDDHTLVRNGLAHLVRSCVKEAEVTEAGNFDEATQALQDTAHDVALVDIRMPGHSGLELLEHIRQTWPALPVIMLTNYDNPEYVKAAMASGAAGYLLKDSTAADLTQAITVAQSGAGNVLSARAISNLFEESKLMTEMGPDGDDSNGQGPRQVEARLTRRETEILDLLAVGHSNREISKRLFLSEKTVKAHLATVFRKLGVSNRTQAAMAAVSMGLGPTMHRPVGVYAHPSHQPNKRPA